LSRPKSGRPCRAFRSGLSARVAWLAGFAFDFSDAGFGAQPREAPCDFRARCGYRTPNPRWSRWRCEFYGAGLGPPGTALAMQLPRTRASGLAELAACRVRQRVTRLRAAPSACART
jgi:hypothetical protein